MAIGKRVRFEVFKRDGFRCLYCGATPQESRLVVDHVEPQSGGGSDDSANLATCCQSCNQGKSNVPLRSLKYVPKDPEEVEEHREQILAYLESQRELEAASDELIGELRTSWEQVYPEGNTIRELSFFRRVCGEFALIDLKRAVAISVSQIPYSRTRAFKYFCGIMRNWRERGVV